MMYQPTLGSTRAICLLLHLLAVLWPSRSSLAAEPLAVDFRYSPPEWQTSICLPDDPQKTLVDRNGDLLYHYGQGGREFGTRLGITFTPDTTWKTQELLSPRSAVVRTTWSAPGLHITADAFAVTGLTSTPATPPILERLDNGGFNRDWAKPPAGFDPSLRHIAVHMGGHLAFAVHVPAGAKRRLALALCEGWWKETGQRIQVLRVEGAAPRVADAVADFGPNRPGAIWLDGQDADQNGLIEVRIEAADQAKDRNTMLNGLWVFPPDQPADSDALLAGKLGNQALARLKLNQPSGPPRNDVVLVRITNRGTEPRTVAPKLIVDTTLPFRFEDDAPRVTIDDHEVIMASRRVVGPLDGKGTLRQLPLESIALAPGQSSEFFLLHSAGGTILNEPATLAAARQSRDDAMEFWARAPLPFGRVQVPDRGVQALVDSSIRNIWQAREIKQGLPVFQVGPTCYRGLWIVDGAFLLEAAAMIGAGAEARNGIVYTLSQQKTNGAFEVLSPQYYKENGIVLWTCVRHAMLTQDRGWLESIWPQLEKAAGYILVLRQKSRENDTSLDDGLNPPGEIDGGLSGAGSGFKRPEFSNVHWNLLGLKAFIQAAHWLRRPVDAARWQKEYDDLYATFRRAAARDLQQDAQGHAYVPAFMANEGHELPQRAQWTFCHAVYPGQIFAKDDPLVASTLAMLEATEREGMVYGTGWDATGIWNYFASFYGHAWLWQGQGRKAAQVLYAYANHASPTCVWREEQSLRGETFKKVGDMPHNWASAEFIRLVIHCLALDRGEELHLLEGFPPEWCGPGMVTQLNGVATPFGPLHLQVTASADARTLTLALQPLAPSCQAVVVHLPDGTTRRLAATEKHTLSFPTANP